MAYMNQEKKAKMQPLMKALLKQYGLKGSLSVRNHSTIVLNIKSGVIDFISNFNDCANVRNEGKEPNHWGYANLAKTHIDVNEYWFKDHFAGVALEFLQQAFKILNIDNFDKSDISTDYFHVGHYTDVNIGDWTKPYICESTQTIQEAA